jgi:hypothetical protein
VRGIEELLRFRESGPWGGSPIRFEPERFVDVDDERVLVLVRVLATGRESGAQVEFRAAQVLTLRDGLLMRFKVSANRNEAIDAVGLSE